MRYTLWLVRVLQRGGDYAMHVSSSMIVIDSDATCPVCDKAGVEKYILSCAVHPGPLPECSIQPLALDFQG